MRLSSRFCLRAAALPAILMLALLPCGKTLLWSQSYEPRTSGSQGTLQTWSELYSEGRSILARQRLDLEAARREIISLRGGYSELTLLSGRLSESNKSLETLVGQIGERMQQRDEDLAWAYGELDAKDLELSEKNSTIWKQRAIIIGICAVLLGLAVFAAIKLYMKFKIPLLK